MSGVRKNAIISLILRFGIALTVLVGMFSRLSASPAMAAGTINLTSFSVYTQNFDTLATIGTTNSTLPVGWEMTESGGGARDNEQYAADSGASFTGDTYSYGAASSTERALGGMRSGTLIPLFGVVFTNNTGNPITSLDISYIGEEWRLGTAGRTDGLLFEYSTDAVSLTTGTWTIYSALNFVTPDTVTTGAKNGNDAADRSSISAEITGLSISNGASFWIRWMEIDAMGADDGLAVDDFSLTPGGCSSAVTVINNAESGAGSLAQAIGDVCPEGTITFDGDYTIHNDEIRPIKNLTIDAIGHVVTLNGAWIIDPGVTIVLDGLILSGNGVGGTAVGIANYGSLTLNRCTIFNFWYPYHSLFEPGAIYSNGTMNIHQSTFRDNFGGDGGAIYNSGTLTIDQSTLMDNQANRFGGAIYNDPLGTMTIRRSTLSQNNSSMYGGAFYGDGQQLFINTTITENTALYGGGLYLYGGSTELINTLVANNSPTQMEDISTIYYSSHNLVTDICGSSCDPLLAPLGNFGGSTQTYALLPGSPAIDAGDNTACLTADQRGVAVPQGATCDIGAFESQGFVLAKTGGDNQSTVINTGFTDPLEVSVTANNPGEPVNGGKVIFTAPSSGASTNPITTTATITSGAVSQNITANGTTGAYTITANAAGASPGMDFSLTNLDPINLSINDVTLPEGDTGTTTFTFMVSLSSPAPVSGVTFDLATADGTGTVTDDDYVARSLTGQTIPAGSSTYTFDIAVNGDNIIEPNETFYVNISNVTGAEVADGQGMGTITNDDFRPTVTTGAATSVTSTGATLNGTVNANNDSTAVTFEYGLTTAYGTTVTADQSPVTGIADTAISFNLSGLSTDTSYHYRVVGENNSGTSYGLDQDFTTSTDFSVTINQFAAQSDPVNIGPIRFTAVFNRAIDLATLISADITLGGSAPGLLSAAITPVGQSGGTTFEIDVTGMSGSGTVTASIGAGKVQDLTGSDNSTSTSIDNVVTYDLSQPAISTTNLDMIYTGIGPDRFVAAFSENVFDPAGNTGDDDVTNPDNYMLINKGLDGLTNTLTCLGGVLGDDSRVPVKSVNYDLSTFEATVTLYSSLPAGSYQLFICGTTSIVDPAGNTLNGGVDYTFDFTVIGTPAKLPATGFPTGMVTRLPVQPAGKNYSATDLLLEIPSIHQTMTIVGVPQSETGWDVTWLGNKAGWLTGSVFPTWTGNSVITGHVWDSSNKPGPFALLRKLQYGDQFHIYAFGLTYTYEVRESKLVTSENVSAVMKHEELGWVTLVTCEAFNEENNTYPYRRMVRAVLVDIKEE